MKDRLLFFHPISKRLICILLKKMRSVRNNVSLTVRFVLWRLFFRLYEGSDYCYVFVFCVTIKMFFLR